MNESRLPGARSNLELAQAAVDSGSARQFEHWLQWTADKAPENTAGCFLAICGTWGLGKLIANGKVDLLSSLRRQANDPRWRVREASAMALQTIGDVNIPILLEIAGQWLDGSWLEQRAVVAGLCEPRLLKQRETATTVLKILDQITSHLADTTATKDENRRILRQALGYGWSVAIVRAPEEGKPYFTSWAACSHPDVMWIVRENLKKKRMLQLGEDWIKRILAMNR